MSILGFFEAINGGELTVPLSREYAELLTTYEKSGYVTLDGETYMLTPKGEKYLTTVKRLQEILASGFVEGEHPDDY